MSQLKKYFDKAGGTGLIKNYFKNGVLGTALCQFLITGKSKTALEILRLSVALKKQQKLYRKYRKAWDAFDKNYVEKEHKESNKLWIFWWQKMDNAPYIVQKCYQSVRQYFDDKDIILITQDNYKQFTEFPQYIIDKLLDGKITLTHFSDLLRLELLTKHGGLWLDATILCTSNDIPQSILNSELFVFRPQKPGSNGKATTLSSWLMYAKTNNRILTATRDMLYLFWEKNNSLTDYYLIHEFFSIACLRYHEEAEKIYPYDNSIPHLLQLHFFQPFNKQWWEDWKKLTPFHKLSYKFSKEDFDKKGTFYDIIFNNQ